MPFAAPWTPPPRMRDREPPPAPTVRPIARSVYAPVTVSAARPKQNAIEHEGYRRLVAAMPCKACGIEGYSQAAHVPPDGKGIKQDDRLTFALCCVRPGIPGCHQDFDQYRMFSSAEARIVGRMWAAETRQSIEAAGTWPANLPKWTEA